MSLCHVLCRGETLVKNAPLSLSLSLSLSHAYVEHSAGEPFVECSLSPNPSHRLPSTAVCPHHDGHCAQPRSHSHCQTHPPHRLPFSCLPTTSQPHIQVHTLTNTVPTTQCPCTTTDIASHHPDHSRTPLQIKHQSINASTLALPHTTAQTKRPHKHKERQTDRGTAVCCQASLPRKHGCFAIIKQT